MKLLSILLSMAMFVAPITAIAQEGDFRITGVKKGQKAPFAGILMTKDSLTKIESDLKLKISLCENKCKLDLEAMALSHSKDVSILKAEVDGLTQFVDVKNRRIRALEEVIHERDASWFTPVVAISSFVLGVITTVGITYAVNR